MRRLRLGTLFLLTVSMMAGAASCGGSSALGHAEWVKAMDSACATANAQAGHASSAKSFGRAEIVEARAVSALRPSLAADARLQRQIVNQLRTDQALLTLAHPSSSQQQQALNADAALTYESMAAHLPQCAVDALLAPGGGRAAADADAASLGENWLCNRGNALPAPTQRQIASVTQRFIRDEAAAPTAPIRYQGWVYSGGAVPATRWFVLTDDYDVITNTCKPTFTRLSLEGAMRSALDRQPEPVPVGNASAAAFVRYLNQVRQANVDFFRTDQLLRADGPNASVLTKKQFAVLQQQLTTDVHEVERVTPPPGMATGHSALVQTVTLARGFERNDATATLGESDWIGNGLVHAEKLRNVWLTVYRLVRKYGVLTPSWADATPAQLSPS